MHRDIVVVGASAGGVEALKALVSALPPDLDAAFFITVHFPEHGTSALPRILARSSRLPVVRAADNDRIVKGRIFVAAPDYHMLLFRRRIRLVHGPKENGNRPAIDPMFRSAALAFGPRVVGVVLTGNLDDGTAGIRAIKRAGGVAVVQDPVDAAFSGMPRSAIENAAVDRVVPLDQVAQVISELTLEDLPHVEHSLMPDDAVENAFNEADIRTIEDADHHPGVPSTFGCPDCGGVLWEIKDGEFTRYRCRIGHAWTSSALFARQADVFDDAMWTALRALEEGAALARQIAARHRARGAINLAQRFEAQAEAKETRAAIVRDTLIARSERAPDDASEHDEADPRRAS